MTFDAGRGAVAVMRSAVVVVLLIAAAVVRMVIGDGWWYAIPLLIYSGFWWYCGRFAKSLSGEMRGAYIRIRYGVLWHRETCVPIRALRTFETFVLPLHRIFRCRTIVLRFAGGSVWLPLLDESTAQAVARKLEGV